MNGLVQRKCKFLFVLILLLLLYDVAEFDVAREILIIFAFLPSSFSINQIFQLL